MKPLARHSPVIPDFADVPGREDVKRALEVAAAGRHAVLMVGPAGSGKFLLALRLPTILPPLDRAQVQEVHQLRSGAPDSVGVLCDDLTPPFRNLHHTRSALAVVGIERPGSSLGEATLAHHGVLYLEDVVEARRQMVDAVVRTMSTGIPTARPPFIFRPRFLLVATAAPCPCGWYGDASRTCRCGEGALKRYRAEFPRALVDRISIRVEVPTVRTFATPTSASRERSETIRKRVIAARAIQSARLGEGRTNAELRSGEIEEHCRLGEAAAIMLRTAVRRLGSDASPAEMLRLARTIADLDDSVDIGASHIGEAAVYRLLPGAASA